MKDSIFKYFIALSVAYFAANVLTGCTDKDDPKPVVTDQQRSESVLQSLQNQMDTQFADSMIYERHLESRVQKAAVSSSQDPDAKTENFRLKLFENNADTCSFFPELKEGQTKSEVVIGKGQNISRRDCNEITATVERIGGSGMFLFKVNNLSGTTKADKKAALHVVYSRRLMKVQKFTVQFEEGQEPDEEEAAKIDQVKEDLINGATFTIAALKIMAPSNMVQKEYVDLNSNEEDEDNQLSGWKRITTIDGVSLVVGHTDDNKPRGPHRLEIEKFGLNIDWNLRLERRGYISEIRIPKGQESGFVTQFMGKGAIDFEIDLKDFGMIGTAQFGPAH